MKHFFFICTLAIATLTASADALKQDTLWGAYCYMEINGKYSDVGFQKTPLSEFSRQSEEMLVYYVLANPCKASIALNISTKKGACPKLNVRVIEVNSGTVVSNQAINTKFHGDNAVPWVMKDTDLRNKSWYRIELTAKDWTGVKSVNHFNIVHNSTAPIQPSPIFMAPSVHLNDWASTNPDAPKGEAYDWAYMEVMLPKKYELKNTYVMSLGVLSGYMGMQVIKDEGDADFRHRVLFSMWDKGNTEHDPNLPDYLRSGALDYADGIEIKRFGGEGTGTRSMIYDSHWQCGNWIQFITTCRPERLNISVKGSAGQDSVIEYTNTLVSAWYKEANEQQWHYLSTLREASRNHYMAGWYSFLENFTDDGGEFHRRAYYRNGYLHSLTDNKWYHRNKVGFGHTQGSDKHPRYDYGHGATAEYPGAFYLEHGGYTLLANDSAMTVPLATDNTPVDTINTTALWNRMEQAIRKEYTREMDMLISKTTDIRALAKRYVDNANRFEYYTAEDTEPLAKLCRDNNTTDAALTEALRALAINANPLKQGKPVHTQHIGITRAYQIMLDNGSTLVDNGTAIGYATDNIATKNTYNWRFIPQGNTNQFLIVNIATKQYFTPATDSKLSATPVAVTITARDGEKGFTLSADGRSLECNLIDNYQAGAKN